jgi:hypothetical protein
MEQQKGAVDRQQLHTYMSGTNEIGHEVKPWKAKGNMHSVDLASAVSSAPVDSALVCSTVASAVSLFVTVEMMASGSASMEVSTPPLPPPAEAPGGSRQGEAEGGAIVRPGETRQGEAGGLGPNSDRRPFESPLYRRAYQFEQIASIEAEHGQRITVQANDVPLNSWARALLRKYGHFYFRNPKAIRWFSGVNTWLAVDTVQKVHARQIFSHMGWRVQCFAAPRGSFPNKDWLRGVNEPRWSQI